MTERAKELCNKRIDDLTSAEKIELIETAYKDLEWDFAAEGIAGMLMDDGVSTSDMLEEIAVSYSADKSEDFRAGFDRACQIFLWKSAPEIAVELLRKAESS